MNDSNLFMALAIAVGVSAVMVWPFGGSDDGIAAAIVIEFGIIFAVAFAVSFGIIYALDKYLRPKTAKSATDTGSK